MATNVARFNKGKGKLDDILNDQIPKNNRKGLGFASTSGTKPTSSKEGAKKFVKTSKNVQNSSKVYFHPCSKEFKQK